MCKCISTTVRVNGTLFFIYFFLGHEIEHYHCHELWFGYCNTCTLMFSSLNHKNGLKKHVWNITKIKYIFVKLVVIFLLFTRCDYVIPSNVLNIPREFLFSQPFLLLYFSRRRWRHKVEIKVNHSSEFYLKVPVAYCTNYFWCTFERDT